MNPNMQTLEIMHAIALYEKLGIVEAINALILYGWTTEEAVEILATYDSYRDSIT